MHTNHAGSCESGSGSPLGLYAKSASHSQQSAPWYRHIREWAKGKGVEVLVFELEDQYASFAAAGMSGLR
jgi:hypothetical protein